MKSDSMPRELELWKDVKLEWQEPGCIEVRLWRAWYEEAKTWNPNPGSKREDMTDWAAVMKTLNMRNIQNKDETPIVTRSFREMSTRSRRLCEIFGIPFEDRQRNG